MSYDPLPWVAFSMGLGAVLVFAAAILLARLGSRPLRWRRLLVAVAIALGLTIIGIAINLLTAPESFGGLLTIAAVITMPGVVMMNVFGRRSLDAPFFFGGFALNILVLASCAYAVLRRVQRA